MRCSCRNIQKWQEHVTQHVTQSAVTNRNDIKFNTAERYALVPRRTLRCRFFEMTVPCVLTTKASDLLERLSTCCVRADNKLSCNSTTQIINDQLCSDIQSSEHVHSELSARQNHGTCLQLNSIFSAIRRPIQPFTITGFSRRAFWFSTPTVWNSMPHTVHVSDSLSAFKSGLLNFSIYTGFHWLIDWAWFYVCANTI